MAQYCEYWDVVAWDQGPNKEQIEKMIRSQEPKERPKWAPTPETPNDKRFREEYMNQPIEPPWIKH